MLTAPLVPSHQIGAAVLADLQSCDEDEFTSWTGHGARGHTAPGERDELRIVDVEGVRLVIDASSFPGSRASDLAEQQSILGSIELDTLGGN